MFAGKVLKNIDLPRPPLRVDGNCATAGILGSDLTLQLIEYI